MRRGLREVMPGFQAPLTAPVSPCEKAWMQVQCFRQGEHNYTRLNDKGTGYLKINIGWFWRLLSRDRGRSWELMSHERYNREIRKTRRCGLTHQR